MRQFASEKVAMKITLVHNPTAGGGECSNAEALVAMIRAANHQVVYQSSQEEGWRKALDAPADVIEAVGGRAARD